jgi:hypothetical protein
MGRPAHVSLAGAVAKRFAAIAEQRAAAQLGGISSSGGGAAVAWSEAGGMRRLAPLELPHAAAAREGSGREYLSRALLRQWRTPHVQLPLAPLPPRLPGAAWGGVAASAGGGAPPSRALNSHPRVNNFLSRMSSVRAPGWRTRATQPGACPCSFYPHVRVSACVCAL